MTGEVTWLDNKWHSQNNDWSLRLQSPLSYLLYPLLLRDWQNREHKIEMSVISVFTSSYPILSLTSLQFHLHHSTRVAFIKAHDDMLTNRGNGQSLHDVSTDLWHSDSYLPWVNHFLNLVPETPMVSLSPPLIHPSQSPLLSPSPLPDLSSFLCFRAHHQSLSLHSLPRPQLPVLRLK